jgi:hypothetical protein
VKTIYRIAVVVALGATLFSTRAQSVAVANYSFEQPPVPPDAPAYPVHVAWQQTPKRADYVESGQFTWNVLTGVFPNPASGAADHIDNMDGAQAAYLFAERENGIFQVVDAKFPTGVSHTLRVGITGSPNIPPAEGSTLAITLYYTNATGAIVPVATTTVTYNTTTFPNGTHLRDFGVKAPAVQNNHPSLGRNVGILIKSTVADASAGGIWDIDNVRLTATREFVQVPNFSFENPPVPAGTPAYPLFNNWQKFPKPSYWDEATMGPWDNLTGVFPNPPAGQDGHIDNIERLQAAYLFATPGNGFYQDLPTPYELNATYTLTANIVGSSSIPPTSNTPITMALYYRDAQSNMMTIASKTIAFTPANFPSATHMAEFFATSSAITAASAPLDKNIGVYFASAAGPDDSGGVWDIDNVRITVAHGLPLAFALEGSDLRISWQSDVGATYRLLKADQLAGTGGASPFTPVGDPITGTGEIMSISVPTTGEMGFFQLLLPPTL